MANDRDPLARVAESFSSRELVDWEAESREHPELTPPLKAMQAIEAVRRVFEESDLTVDTVAGSAESPEPVAVAPGSWGKLQIIDRLGHGAGGDVYLANDPMLQRQVALKLVRTPPQGRAADLALEEARKLARVDHPNVVKIHGVEQHDGQWGLWMDLVSGESLDRFAKQRGVLGADEALTVGRAICRALAAVHREGLVHRDVKASNVMRSAAGEYVLMDFGLVRDANQDSQSAAGTPLYMSPQLFENQPASVASDLYALGVTLFWLVTGRYPVRGSSLAELREKHAKRERERLVDLRPELAPEFVGLVERLLSRDEAERFQSAGDVMAAMGGAASSDVGGDPSAPGMSLVRRMALVLGVLIVLAGAAWLMRGALTPFQTEAALYRYVENGVPELLAAGGTLRVGDQFYLEVQGTKPTHLYVVNYDSEDRAYVLFPLPAFDLNNPVAASTRHRIPGMANGEEVYWDVTSAAGTETILVMTSPQPLDFVEERLASLPQAQSGVLSEVGNSEFVSTLRGIGGFSPGHGDVGGSAEDAGRAAQLAFESARRGDVSAFEFRFQGAGR